MRLERRNFWFLILIGSVSMLRAPLALADAGVSDSDDQASSLPKPYPAADTMTSDESTKPLSQYPQAETAAAQPAAMQASTNPNNAHYNFPKVMTPEDQAMAKKFDWWPTDAKPGPVKDPDRSGYWWWPETPGEARPWGNQGFVYVRKIIFDYKTTEGPMKPSLIIKKVLKNVKVLFDYDKSDLRDDARNVLDQAMDTLSKNPKADILITGNADIRGSEQYNQKLGERRAEAVRKYIADQGLAESRIRVLSRGKLDAMAPRHDLVGMQKDRNAQFMVAEVEEVMIPADKAEYFGEKQKVVEEKQELTGEVRVSEKEYVIQAGDTLWKIAEREYGNGRQWKRIYEYNKDVIANPDRPKKGTRIKIPIE